MFDFQKAVEEFHKTFGIKIGDKEHPQLDYLSLREELIREEFGEYVQATQEGNITKTIDALCDIIYVAFGAAVTFGVDIEPFFRAVHDANMKKAGGHKREDGKWIKPEGWQPPDIEGILENEKRIARIQREARELEDHIQQAKMEGKE